MSTIVLMFEGDKVAGGIGEVDQLLWKAMYQARYTNTHAFIAALVHKNQLYRGSPMCTIATMVPQTKMAELKMTNLNGRETIDFRRLLADADRTSLCPVKRGLAQYGLVQHYCGRHRIAEYRCDTPQKYYEVSRASIENFVLGNN